MKKIGFFIDVNFNRGGAPISTKILAEGIARENYESVIVKPYSQTEEKIKNIKVMQIKEFENEFPFMLLHPIKWIRLCKYIYKNIKQEKYDIIHANMPFSGMAIGMLKKLNLLGDIFLIYTDREHVADLKWYHRIRYKIFIANEFNKIITISQKSERYWNKIRKDKNTSTIYNTATSAYEELTSKENKENKLEVLFVGRIAKDKNWKLAIEIAQKLPECNIVFIWSYFNEEQKQEAEDMHQKLVENSNITIKYNLNVDDIKSYYAKADIFIMTSRREAFGRTAVEAMSQKTVVIGTNVGGIPEVISKKENILEADSTKFLERIRFYDKNRKELEQDKEFFYQRYKKNFSLKANIDNYNKIYKEIEKNEK